MNANELADWLENHVCGAETTKEVIVMLRQQQAEIEALKAHPVKELTDEEIISCAEMDFVREELTNKTPEYMWIMEFARAILRKAQEK